MRSTFAAFALLVILPFPLRAEEVEHPAFRSWAHRSPGTTIAIRSVTANPNSKITTTTTTKLVRIEKDMAVLETRQVSDATGKVVEGRPDRLDQRRMFPVMPGIKKEMIGKPVGAVDQGEETLELAGRKIKATWYDTKGRGDAGETLTRTWLSDEVPGRLVKAVTQIPKASTTVTLELVRFDVPEPTEAQSKR